MAARSRHLFRMPESTLGIETLPPQSDVYIPRHLSQVNEPGDGQVRQRNRSVSGHVYGSRSIPTTAWQTAGSGDASADHPAGPDHPQAVAERLVVVLGLGAFLNPGPEP